MLHIVSRRAGGCLDCVCGVEMAEESGFSRARLLLTCYSAVATAVGAAGTLRQTADEGSRGHCPLIAGAGIGYSDFKATALSEVGPPREHSSRDNAVVCCRAAVYTFPGIRDHDESF